MFPDNEDCPFLGLVTRCSVVVGSGKRRINDVLNPCEICAFPGWRAPDPAQDRANEAHKILICLGGIVNCL